MILKGSLHVHTTNSDGQLVVDEVLALYKVLRYDFIAITDHNHYTGASDPDLMVFEGCELSNDARVGQHVNHIKGDSEELWILNHPARYKNSVDDVNRMCAEFGLHLVETTEHGWPTFKYLNCSIPAVATDDMHVYAMAADAWVLVDVLRKDMDLVLQALKAGDFVNCGPEYDIQYVRWREPRAAGGW